MLVSLTKNFAWTPHLRHQSCGVYDPARTTGPSLPIAPLPNCLSGLSRVKFIHATLYFILLVDTTCCEKERPTMKNKQKSKLSLQCSQKL